MRKSDVIIIGGGPAGAACARRLAEGGADALILEKAAFPRPKPCAGWISPDVLRTLKPHFGDYPHGLTHFSRFDVSVKKLRFRMRTNQYAVRRIEFDNWLLRRSDIPVIRHTAAAIREKGGGFTVDDQFFCERIVGAGGTYCPVRRQLFGTMPGSGVPERETSGPENRENRLIVAMEEEFPYPHSTDMCRLWFLQDELPGYAWYVPKAEGFVNIGVGGKAGTLKAGGDRLNRHWRILLEKLEQEGLVSGHEFRPRGHSYYLRRKNPCLSRGRACLTGDAAGLATLDMGEGIGPAVKSGIQAAEAILKDTEYSVKSISPYSFPSLVGLRR